MKKNTIIAGRIILSLFVFLIYSCVNDDSNIIQNQRSILSKKMDENIGVKALISHTIEPIENKKNDPIVKTIFNTQSTNLSTQTTNKTNKNEESTNEKREVSARSADSKINKDEIEDTDV